MAANDWEAPLRQLKLRFQEWDQRVDQQLDHQIAEMKTERTLWLLTESVIDLANELQRQGKLPQAASSRLIDSISDVAVEAEFVKTSDAGDQDSSTPPPLVPKMELDGDVEQTTEDDDDAVWYDSQGEMAQDFSEDEADGALVRSPPSLLADKTTPPVEPPMISSTPITESPQPLFCDDKQSTPSATVHAEERESASESESTTPPATSEAELHKPLFFCEKQSLTSGERQRCSSPPRSQFVMGSASLSDIDPLFPDPLARARSFVEESDRFLQPRHADWSVPHQLFEKMPGEIFVEVVFQDAKVTPPSWVTVATGFKGGGDECHMLDELQATAKMIHHCWVKFHKSDNYTGKSGYAHIMDSTRAAHNSKDKGQTSRFGA